MFKPSQKIISICNHPDRVFLKGTIFTVMAIKNSPCNCHAILVDIGIRDKNSKFESCTECQYRFATNSTIHWFSNKHFAPIDYSFADNILDMVYEEALQHSDKFVLN
jgi:hypothetical protein